MADLNVNKSDTIGLRDDCGENLVMNGDFETAPSFTAATTTQARWIDGTAGGSTTNDIYRWAISSIVNSGQGQFDSTVSHGGTNSLKLSTTAVNSRIDGSTVTSNSLSNSQKYNLFIQPSTQYKLTYWMKTNVTSGSSQGAFMRTVQRAADDTQGTISSGTAVNTTVDWTQYSITFTSASTAFFVQIQPLVIGNSGSATLVMDAWFDDVFFQSTTPNGNVSLLVTPLVTAGVQDISGPKIWS